ncbi:MAG TPA: hypothetical protein VH681_05470, partial [Nitrospiraceae bacterium]
ALTGMLEFKQETHDLARKMRRMIADSLESGYTRPLCRFVFSSLAKMTEPTTWEVSISGRLFPTTR